MDHTRSPFPAPLLGYYPWYNDRPITHPLSPAYNDVAVMWVAEVLEGRVNIGPSFGESGNREGYPREGATRNIFLSENLFRIHMRMEWQELPNWKSAMVEGLTWERTAEENTQKYISLVK